MEDLKLQYRNLETKVFAELRQKVNNSKEHSKHINGKCIKVNLFGYTELVIIHDQLTFLDDAGMSYSLWNGDCGLEDFIDILTVTN